MTESSKCSKGANQTTHDERHRFWTEQALNQFGFASNFFFLLSFAFFTFLMNREITKKLLPFDFKLSFSFSKFFFVLALVVGFVSIVFGALTVLSRLYDLRLTRHKTYVRKRYNKVKGGVLCDDDINIDNYSFFKKINVLYKSSISRAHFIIDKDIEDQQLLSEKFMNLRINNLLLERLSWTTFSYQIITLLISLFTYFLSVLF
ncbi:hypothetical protein ACR78F_00110 [Sphingobacterium spiritivorum]|uniref:hypothetical protein n=1 Tax=Sphingobacterium spiritivorum TaxID=258 RepID=UPI003DA20657